MKTAVSLPDELFAAADRVASRLGVSRSELYARAIAAYIREHEGEVITQRINRVVAAANPGLDPILARMQAMSLGPDEGSFEDWVERAPRRDQARGRRHG